MTWYAGVKSGNAVNPEGEPFDSDDELRDHIRQNRANFDEEPYVVQLQEGHKSVYRARFKSNESWDLEPLMKYSAPVTSA